MLLSAFFVCLLIGVLLAAQAGEEKREGASADPDQLARTAESYENLLRGTTLASEPRLEVQERLGAIYFLLHRYRDSLNLLTPILADPIQAQSAEKNAVTASAQARSLWTQSWLVTGLDYLELDQLPDATRTLRHALSLDPSNANARLALGDALAQSGRMDDAIDEYQRQTRLTPSLADAWYKLGLAHSQISVELSHEKVRPSDESIVQQLAAEELLAKGDTMSAARTLFRVLSASPGQPEVQAELGSALLTLGYTKSAQDHFTQELANNPESPLAQLGLAQTAALTGDWGQVGSTVERLSESQPRELVRLLEFPPAPPLLQASGKGQITPPESFTHSPAGAIWQSWLSDSNVVAKIFATGGGTPAHSCAGDQSKEMRLGIWLTERCYSKLANEMRDKTDLSSNGRTKLTESEFRLGEYDAALRSAQLLHAANPHNGWALYWLSKSHDAMAEQCFLKVAALNPDSPRVHEMLGEHYSKLSDYAKAKTEFQNALRFAPDSPDLHLGLGTVLSKTGDWAEAEKELKTTLVLAPKSAFAHYQLGHVYLQQGRWQEAIDQLRQVPAGSSVLLSARLDQAKAESEIGETSQAVGDLLSVESLDQDGELYFRLAALYRMMGDASRAHDALVAFKQRRAASLQTDAEEIGELEKEQEANRTDHPQ